MIKLIKIALFITVLASACARKAPVPGLDPAKPVVQQQDIFFVAMLDRPVFTENDKEKLPRIILSDWYDILSEIEKTQEPVAVCLSARALDTLNKIEQEQVLPGLAVKPPEDLTSEEVKYLTDRHGINKSTSAAKNDVIQLQVREMLSYLGESLKDEDAVQDILGENDYDSSHKEELIEFISGKIDGFNYYLKGVLDQDYVYEAVSSLSHAYLNLLYAERIRTQVFESMIRYNNWRGSFPEGFVSRGGYINKEVVEEFEKTGLRWITARVENEEEYRTKPQLLRLYDGNPSSKPAAVVSDSFDVIKGSEKVEYNLIGLGRYMKRAGLSADDEELQLSASGYVYSEMELKEPVPSIKEYLADASRALIEFRNSGRAGIRTINEIQRILLKAESGEMLDKIDEAEVDFTFRSGLIEIYRKIGLSPPKELFLSLSERVSVLPDREMSATLEIECDGVVSEGEWDGSASAEVSTDTYVSWGYDSDNIYFLFKSTAEFKNAGVYLGHTDAGASALYTRGSEDKHLRFPLYLEAAWNKKSPDETRVYRTTGDENWEVLTRRYDVGTSTGVIEFSLPFRYVDARGMDDIYISFYVEQEEKKIFPEDGYFSFPAPYYEDSRNPIDYLDPAGDNRGPGDYVLPEELKDYSDSLDFRRIQINESDGEKIISIELSEIENPYEAPLGFSASVIDIYVDINRREGLGNIELLPGRNAFTKPEDAWEYCITVSGWGGAIYNTSGRSIGVPGISVNPLENTINIFISEEDISTPVERWGVIPVLLAADEDGEVMTVREGADERYLSGRRMQSDTNILDVVLPPGYSQSDVLGANRLGRAIEIPALRKRQ